MAPKIFEFKIRLQEIKPMIWRRIQIPENFTFNQFHHVIQDAMGWFNSHMHYFEMRDPATNKKVEIQSPLMYIDPDSNDRNIVMETDVILKNYFSLTNNMCYYEYDMGDSWGHVIRLEKIIDARPKVEYPRIVSGKRACPPEDCGSTPGYYELCDIIKNPRHKEYQEMIEWLRGIYGRRPYDPNHFDKSEVEFSGTIVKFV